MFKCWDRALKRCHNEEEGGFRIGLEDESAIKEYVLNLAGWVDVNEFRRTYDIRPFKFYKNARGLENLKNISDKLRANDLSE